MGEERRHRPREELGDERRRRPRRALQRWQAPSWNTLTVDELSEVMEQAPTLAVLTALSQLEKRTHELCRDKLARLKRLTQAPFFMPTTQLTPRKVCLQLWPTIHYDSPIAKIDAFVLACNSGMLPKLDMIMLFGSAFAQLGDAGLVAVLSIFRNGAFPNLRSLHLNGFKFGDAGAMILASAFSTPGVLPQLECLGLFDRDSQCGDAGAIAFASALRGGALPSLVCLMVSGSLKSHPEMVAAVQARGLFWE